MKRRSRPQYTASLKAERRRAGPEGITIADAVKRVLHLPTVAEKPFLVTW
ncbi:hypothetical protein ACLB1E_14840 [Escherichia coli]